MNSNTEKIFGGISSNFITVIEHQRKKIRSIWYNSFRKKCARKDYDKIPLTYKIGKNKMDILDFLFMNLKRNMQVKKEHLFAVLYRILKEDISIFYFFLEVSCLEESIVHTLKNSTELSKTEYIKGCTIVKRQLRDLFTSVLKKSSAIYQDIFDAPGRGFFQVDSEGKIIFANNELKRILNSDKVVGKPFGSFFNDDDREVFEKVFYGEMSTKGNYVYRLNVKWNSGEQIPVYAILGSIFIDGEHLGGYAEMINLSLVESAERRLFDMLPAAILRSNINGQIIYANSSALNIFGADTLYGMRLSELFRDEDKKKPSEFFYKRLHKRLGEKYILEIKRVSDGKSVPIEISAVPELDITGKVMGSFAILRSIVKENTSEMIRSHIEYCRNWKDMLKEVANDVGNAIMYDIFIIWAYSADRRYRRQLFSFSLAKPLEWSKGWMELPQHNEDWGKDEVIVIDDLKSFLKNSKKLKQDFEIQILQKDGFFSLMRRMVLRNNRVIATIILASKRKSAFNRTDVQLFRDFPLDSAVFRALDYGIQSIEQVFISYEKEDTELAHRLAEDLRKLDVEVWIAPESVSPGESWVDGINRALEKSKYTLIIVTPAAMKSQWVKHETNSAIALERKGLMQVIPLNFKTCEMPPLWNNYQMISFQQDYNAGFQRLAKTLGLYV